MITPIPPVSPVYPISKSKNHAVVWIVTGAVILTIGIGVGLILGKYSPKQISSYEDCMKAKGSSVQESNPPTCVTANGLRFKGPAATLTPTSDPTANWKTYTNGNYNYQFKYPLDWPDIPPVVSNQKDGFQLAGQNVYLSQYFPQVKPPQLQIEVFKSNKELRPDELEEKESCGFPTFAISKSKVGGLQAIVGRRLAPRDPSAPYYIGLHYCVRTYSGGFIYNFLWEEGSDVDSGLFDQILSTFRFLGTLDKNYLYLMRFNRDKPPPDSTRYIKNKDIIMEFPEEVTVRNEPIYAQGAIISDANVTIDDNTYYLSNLMGFPHGRYDRCYDEYYSGAESSEENCVFQFETGSPVSVLRWVSDEKGVFLLNIQDIKIETYHIDNFTIYKGPINQNTPPGKAYVQGRFTKEEIQKWIGLVKNVKAVPVSN